MQRMTEPLRDICDECFRTVQAWLWILKRLTKYDIRQYRPNHIHYLWLPFLRVTDSTEEHKFSLHCLVACHAKSTAIEKSPIFVKCDQFGFELRWSFDRIIDIFGWTFSQSQREPARQIPSYFRKWQPSKFSIVRDFDHRSLFDSLFDYIWTFRAKILSSVKEWNSRVEFKSFENKLKPLRWW